MGFSYITKTMQVLVGLQNLLRNPGQKGPKKDHGVRIHQQKTF